MNSSTLNDNISTIKDNHPSLMFYVVLVNNTIDSCIISILLK